MSTPKLYSVNTTNSNAPIMRLIVDDTTAVHVGDKPVFGSQITIKDTLASLNGKVLLPGLVLGWVDYVETKKFGCLTNENHYIDASNFIYVDQNELKVSKPIKLINFSKDVKSSKQIFSFCEA